MKNNEKCVVITGAAKGLGLAISKEVIQAGYTVIGVGRTESLEFRSLPLEKREFIEFDLYNLENISDLVNQIINISGDIGAKKILELNKDKILNLEINDQCVTKDFNTQDSFD